MFTIVSSTHYMRSLPEQHGKEVRYIGNSENSAFRAYYFLLLHIELEERKAYPHLRNIIREQLNKDYILRKQHQDDEYLRKSKEKHINPNYRKIRKDSRDSICEMYFEIVNQWSRIEDFIIRNVRFDDLCINMIQALITNRKKYSLNGGELDDERNPEVVPTRDLNNNNQTDTYTTNVKNSLKQSRKSIKRNHEDEYRFLCKKFNIEFEVIHSEDEDTFSVYRLGSSKRFLVIM